MSFKQAALIITLILTSTVHAQRAVVATTDFTTGSLSSIDTQTNQATNDLLLIHSDARVRTSGDRVYVINRLPQDNIIVLAKDDLATPIAQYSTGDGSNPHEIAVIDTEKAYVTLYARDYLLVINPATGDSLGAVDLSAYADADGLPEASQMAVFDNTLFVAVQRLNRDTFFSPTDFSVIVAVDIATDQIIDLDPDAAGDQGIVLEGKQPFGSAQRGGKWILGTVGSFFNQDGGIEIVNLLTRTTEGFGLTEEALGGDVGPIAMLSDEEGYIVVTDASFANTIKRFNLSTGTISDPLSDHSGGFTPGMAVLNASLFVLDQGTSSEPTSVGVRVYDTSTDQLAAGPISTGLPPFDIVFLDASPADYDGSGTVAFEDFLLFAAAFGTRQGEDGFASQFDLHADGLIDFTDFLVFASNFGD